MNKAVKKRYSFRFDESFMQIVDEWAEAQESKDGIRVNRTQAIRLLVSKGLNRSNKRSK